MAVEPGLYLVATPIGNLEDITLRALRILKEVDRIACEDTRQTQKLLHHFSISTPTVSYHEHNEQSRTVELLAHLQQGGSVALVTDAGTPVFSDPGLELVRAAVAAGMPVVPVPGANAAVSALIASGLDTDRFLFAGFLAVVARELTKLHEEFLRGTVREIREHLAGRDRIRGEIVLLVDGSSVAAAVNRTGSVREQVSALMSAEGLDEKEALKRVARERGVSKSDVYRELQRDRSKK